MDLLKIKSKTDLQRALRTNPLALAESIWQLIQQHHALKMTNIHLLKTIEESSSEMAQLDLEISNLREGIND